MNKFYMLLLSATICATSPTFAMDPEDEPNFAPHLPMTQEEYDSLPESLREKLGYALNKLHLTSKTAQTNPPSSLPSEFFSTTPVEEPSFSRFPKPIIIQASEVECARFEAQRQAQLSSQSVLHGYGQQEEPQSALPAEFFSSLPKTSSFLVPQLRAAEIEENLLANTKSVQYTTEYDQMSVLPISAKTILSLGNIREIALLKGKYFKSADGAVYQAEQSEKDLACTAHYLALPAFEFCGRSDKKNIDLIKTTVTATETEITYTYKGGPTEVDSPWYGVVDFDNPTHTLTFKEQLVILKKVDLKQFIVGAVSATISPVLGNVLPSDYQRGS